MNLLERTCRAIRPADQAANERPPSRARRERAFGPGRPGLGRAGRGRLLIRHQFLGSVIDAMGASSVSA